VAIANLGGARTSNPFDADFPQQTTGETLVQMLIERGANPNQQVSYPSAVGGGYRGATPFLVAVGSGNIDLVKQLVASGANVKLATAEGQGAIHAAVQARGRGAQVALIKYLAAQGADAHLMAERNWRYRTRGGSALHYAVRTGNLQIVQAVVELGVDLNRKDNDGVTALDYAMGRGHVAFMQQPQPPNIAMADFLRSKGANVELEWIPVWPHDGAPLSTNAYDSKLWPVDPKGP
jgi:ankyrin repeat protein